MFRVDPYSPCAEGHWVFLPSLLGEGLPHSGSGPQLSLATDHARRPTPAISLLRAQEAEDVHGSEPDAVCCRGRPEQPWQTTADQGHVPLFIPEAGSLTPSCPWGGLFLAPLSRLLCALTWSPLVPVCVLTPSSLWTSARPNELLSPHYLPKGSISTGAHSEAWGIRAPTWDFQGVGAIQCMTSV